MNFFLPDILSRIPWALFCAAFLVIILYINLVDQAATQAVARAKVEARKRGIEDTPEPSPFPWKKPKTDQRTVRTQTRTDSLAQVLGIRQPRKSQEIYAKDFPWLTWLQSAIIIAVLTFFYSIIRERERDQQYIKNQDPEELGFLFNKYAQQIVILGTPRKVKRFSNSFRFQYNLFKLSGIIQTSQQADYFFRLSIQAETNRDWYQLPYDEFASKFFLRNQDEQDEILLKKLYQYNTGQ